MFVKKLVTGWAGCAVDPASKSHPADITILVPSFHAAPLAPLSPLESFLIALTASINLSIACGRGARGARVDRIHTKIDSVDTGDSL